MRKLLLVCFLLLPITVVIGEPTQPATLLAFDKPLASTPIVKTYTFYCSNASQSALPAVQKKYTIKKLVPVTDTELKTATDGKYTYPIASVVTADGTYYCALTGSNDMGEGGYSGEVNFLLVAGGAYNVGIPAVLSGFEVR